MTWRCQGEVRKESDAAQRVSEDWPDVPRVIKVGNGSSTPLEGHQSARGSTCTAASRRLEAKSDVMRSVFKVRVFKEAYVCRGEVLSCPPGGCLTSEALESPLCCSFRSETRLARCVGIIDA